MSKLSPSQNNSNETHKYYLNKHPESNTNNVYANVSANRLRQTFIVGCGGYPQIECVSGSMGFRVKGIASPWLLAVCEIAQPPTCLHLHNETQVCSCVCVCVYTVAVQGQITVNKCGCKQDVSKRSTIWLKLNLCSRARGRRSL